VAKATTHKDSGVLTQALPPPCFSRSRNLKPQPEQFAEKLRTCYSEARRAPRNFSWISDRIEAPWFFWNDSPSPIIAIPVVSTSNTMFRGCQIASATGALAKTWTSVLSQK
jgi:hypothetical protein